MTSGGGGGIALLTSQGGVGDGAVEELVALDDNLHVGVIEHGIACAGASQAYPMGIPGEG